MKKEYKDLWIKALESGNYKQTTEGLLWDNQHNKYCCLGVLTDVVSKKLKRTWAQLHTKADDAYLSLALERITGLSTAYPEFTMTFQEWNAYIPDPNYLYGLAPTEYEGKVTYTLTELNDDMGMRFEDIARLIRDKIPGT